MSLWQPALIIAALGAIESLLSAVVADGMKSGEKHDSKRELFGQGIANIITPLFGGIPATGAIARTATNIRSGAVSPVSGVVQSLFVLAFLLLFAPYASYIPLAAMAPILMFVAWNMSAQESIRSYPIDSIGRFYCFIDNVSIDDFHQLNDCGSSWYFACSFVIF